MRKRRRDRSPFDATGLPAPPSWGMRPRVAQSRDARTRSPTMVMIQHEPATRPPWRVTSRKPLPTRRPDAPGGLRGTRAVPLRWLLRILIFLGTFLIAFFFQTRVASAAPVGQEPPAETSAAEPTESPPAPAEPEEPAPDGAGSPAPTSPGEPAADPAPPRPEAPSLLGSPGSKVETSDPLVDSLPVPGKKLPGSHRDLGVLELGWRVQLSLQEILGHTPTEPESRSRERFFAAIYARALGASARAGVSDNPRIIARALTDELFEARELRVREEGATVHEILPASALELGSAHPITAGVLFLAVAEVVRPGLEFFLEDSPGGVRIRFREARYRLDLHLTGSRPGIELEASTGLDEPDIEAPDRKITRAQLEARLHQALGEVLVESEDPDRAVQAFARSLELHPDLRASQLSLAHLARSSGDLGQARRRVERLLEVSPDLLEARELHARVLIEIGETRGARRAIEELLRLDPDRAGSFHVLLGDLERREGRWEKALEHYDRARAVATRPEDLERLRREAEGIERARQVAILRGPAPDAEKFQAIRRLARHPTRSSFEALIQLLEDPNLRLARLAWKTLRTLSGEELDFAIEPWRAWLDSRPEFGLQESR